MRTLILALLLLPLTTLADEVRIAVGQGSEQAIDSKGHIYSNVGHVCGGLHLAEPTPNGFRSIIDFLATDLPGQELGPDGPKQTKVKWKKCEPTK